MAIPIISTIGGGIIAGLVQFFASRAGAILAGLGLTYVGVKGFETFIGFIISDFNLIASTLQSQGGSLAGSGAGAIAMRFAAFVGFFDALNIIISGYLSFASLIGMRVILARLK